MSYRIQRYRKLIWFVSCSYIESSSCFVAVLKIQISQWLPILISRKKFKWRHHGGICSILHSTFPMRDFLHAKLDEVLRIWHRGSGQVCFMLSIEDRTPNFQHWIHLILEDDWPASGLPQSDIQNPTKPLPRKWGPAKLAKNRQRAAAYQAARAASATNQTAAVSLASSSTSRAAVSATT